MDLDTTELVFPVMEDGPEVSAILTRPSDGAAILVLGHGAGTPILHPLMAETAIALANEGIATFRFNYPYSERGDVSDYKNIDPLEILLATARSAVNVAAGTAPELPLFVGGRSMSSQVMSLAVAQGAIETVRGVVLMVFPMRWHELLDDTVEHLRNISVPMLFVQGDRDHLTELSELHPVLVGLGEQATLFVVEGADHFYNMLASSGKTRGHALSQAAGGIREWMNRLI